MQYESVCAVPLQADARKELCKVRDLWKLSEIPTPKQQSRIRRFQDDFRAGQNVAAFIRAQILRFHSLR